MSSFSSMSPPLPKTTSLSTFTLACAGFGDCANARVPSAGSAVPAENAFPMNPRLVSSLIASYLPWPGWQDYSHRKHARQTAGIARGQRLVLSFFPILAPVDKSFGIADLLVFTVSFVIVGAEMLMMAIMSIAALNCQIDTRTAI